ncbi:hypothetical protein LXA43DRAFT_1104881 [Ganoderma leucocontextum]|nr:hypothetical protein LXA43DRAFT_1104881 [Ganoderma leucocontextum]
MLQLMLMSSPRGMVEGEGGRGDQPRNVFFCGRDRSFSPSISLCLSHATSSATSAVLPTSPATSSLLSTASEHVLLSAPPLILSLNLPVPLARDLPRDLLCDLRSAAGPRSVPFSNFLGFRRLWEQAFVAQDQVAALQADCQTLRVVNLRLQHQLSALENRVALQEKELVSCEAQLFIYRSQAHGYNPTVASSAPGDAGEEQDEDEDDSVEIIGPNPTDYQLCIPTRFIPVRPTPTDDELLTSSMWSESGRPDPSVDIHPLSSWYRWFRTTHPIANNALILTPDEPASTDAPRPIPYSLPNYVFTLLGPDAMRKDQNLADGANRRMKAGRQIKPPPPRPGLYGDLGEWEDKEIVTVLQAHNLRQRAIGDRDICAYLAPPAKRARLGSESPSRPRSDADESSDWDDDDDKWLAQSSRSPIASMPAPSEVTPAASTSTARLTAHNDSAPAFLDDSPSTPRTRLPLPDLSSNAFAPLPELKPHRKRRLSDVER